MFKKLGLLVGGIAALYSLEACVIVGNGGSGGSAGDGSGGDGNTGNTGTAGTGGMASSSSSGSAGAGVGGGMPACEKTCGLAIASMVPVCDTSPASLDLYKALSACSCEKAVVDGGCKDVCGPNLCTGGSPDMDCGKCVQDTAAGCGDEFGACSNDV